MSGKQLLHSDRSIGFTVSFLLHALLLTVGGLVFAKPVEYAVEMGAGGVEVNLVAAPAELAASVTPVMQDQPKPEDILQQNEVEEQVVAPPAPQVSHSSDSGKDKTTFHSEGGALTEAMPNYLKNPAPAYPWEARQNGWYGTVILRVQVDRTGHPVKVEKEKSSGHSILDGSA